LLCPCFFFFFFFFWLLDVSLVESRIISKFLCPFHSQSPVPVLPDRFTATAAQQYRMGSTLLSTSLDFSGQRTLLPSSRTIIMPPTHD
jgi:hypothetical protein